MSWNVVLEVLVVAQEKRSICECHDEIDALAMQLMKDLEFGKPYKRSLKRIVAVAKEAKGYGQKMENRLAEYREGVEAMGFERSEV